MDGDDEPVERVEEVTPKRVGIGLRRRMLVGAVLVAVSLGALLMCRDRADDRPKVSPASGSGPGGQVLGR